MTEEKTLGRVCFEARFARTPGALWDDVGEEGRGDYERAAQAVVGAWKAKWSFDLSAPTRKPERKGKRLEARVEELEYWRNQGALR